jgi:hypothetical protein
VMPRDMKKRPLPRFVVRGGSRTERLIQWLIRRLAINL